jgi:tellurite resistance-related uncharacterized protein
MPDGDSGTEQQERPDEGVVDQSRCATCERVINPSDWHPVATLSDDSGFHLFTFCSIECRDKWKEMNE